MFNLNPAVQTTEHTENTENKWFKTNMVDTF